jgi:hypothetical protein
MLQTPELRIDEFHVAALDVDPGLNLRLCFHALELNIEIAFNPSSESSFEMKQAHSLWNNTQFSNFEIVRSLRRRLKTANTFVPRIFHSDTNDSLESERF